MIEGIRPELEPILAAANQAPSGENCQPWHFKVKDLHIEVHLLPDRDQSYYGWGQRASYMANGAAIENMCIAASVEGFKATVTYLPSPADQYHVASIDLVKDPSGGVDLLHEHVLLRATNRKPYMIVSPSEHELEELTKAQLAGSYGKILFTTELPKIKRLAEVGASNEEIMLSNEALHKFFFSHLNWTKEEDSQKHIGFYIKTLELPGPALAAFYILQYWEAMQMLNKISFEKFVSSQNAAIYQAAGAMGAITLDGDAPLDYIKGGRMMQRLWLTATKMGFSMQPLTGILFFKLKIDNGEGAVFSDAHQQKINAEYQEAQKIFGCEGKRIGFMFRLGSGAAPSAHSSRFPIPQIVEPL